MTTVATRRLLALAPLAALVACGTEQNGGITATLAASQTANFSAWSEPVPLRTINTSANEQQRALSKDGLTLFFASNRTGSLGGNDIWVSQRADVDADWGAPVHLEPPINTEFGDAAPNLSRDEHQLFFTSTRPEGSFGSNDIWVSHRQDVHNDFAWEAPLNLGPGVNTAAGAEIASTYFANEAGGAPQLFFNRQTPPTAPGDIYVSELSADGTWGTASLVAELNSPAADQKPSISHSGLDIYFWSHRTGIAHIWHATRGSVLDPWSAPTEVGAPISGPGEIHPFIFSHGRTEALYFVRTVPGNGLDIFVTRRTREGGL